MSVWNPENVTDVAESVGIGALNKEVAEHLARDVEYRISQVLEEALKFMRHGKRTTLTTQDVSQALRLLGVEPLYGYDSTRPLRFGEASIGPGQPLFYVEDEEVDFEKLINAPLPKVPREVSITAHWLAVEGVQPSIPQNPTQADQRNQELAAKGQNANATLAAVSGADNVAVKPLVKHVLSKELQLYFERVCGAVLDESNDEYRTAALSSLRTDPGIHQLVPYFTQFVAEKVTHSLKSLFVLTQSMQLLAALLDNPSLYLAPHITHVIPPVLTCLVGKRLGPPPPPASTSSNTNSSSTPDPSSVAHFALRDYAASLLASIARRYSPASATLRPRVARACLKHFLDSHKPFGTHYGAVLGLATVAGGAGVRALVLPHLAAYDTVLAEGLRDEARREQAEHVVDAIWKALEVLERDAVGTGGGEGRANGHPEGAELRGRLEEALGEAMGSRVYESGRHGVIDAVLEKDLAV